MEPGTAPPDSAAAGDVAEPAIDTARHVAVLIIGSGFAGLGAAIRLEKSGRHDFLVIERGCDVGGTWRDNTYPGAACDVPSHLYSYSFALNPGWSWSFSRQGEIQEYLRRTARQFGVLDRHLFNCEMLSARWDSAADRWVVLTSQGLFTATVLVGAFGSLSDPKLPDIKGIDTFDGELFHSARWQDEHDIAGRRIAIIGTGASAIQLVPKIARAAQHLDVYQRTAPWVMGRNDRKYTTVERFLFRHVPGFQRISRGLIYGGRELLAIGFCYAPWLLGVATELASSHLRRQINDPNLLVKLTPDYRIGCKRVLLSNDFYPALTRSNVELVTDGIAEIVPQGIVTASGKVREVDTLILATGFHPTDSPAAKLITGTDGRTLADHWNEGGQQAYKGATVAGFPNMFWLIGPNTELGHNSMIYMIESQLNYLLSALEEMDLHQLATVEVRKSVQDKYNARIQARLDRTVWASGCASWYLDKHGRNTTLWPGFTFIFRALTRKFDTSAYQVSHRNPT